MRLTAIKLAGFKSFVDPTIFRAPTNLTGIVGPNGCGKSNIIDAVRWVMGEISAKLLRGESMTDVIFSGSSARKPVGTATVELIFENNEGRVGGEYAQFSEISVKRTVGRDGQSAYFLNGTRCRRKDITDLFLGTGLGSRSYSIIEQGMISQIVEARPEEIRAHLEEAAGISRYKERRRETENRIRHTRDNLDRLSDLREEIGKHLDKLKRQSRAAERWKVLKAEHRQREGQMLALRWRAMADKAEAQQHKLAEQNSQLEKQIAEQRSREATLESLRERQHDATEVFNKIQGEVYEVAGEIARIEQAIEHARELRERQRGEFEETKRDMADLEQHLVLDRTQVETLTAELGASEPALEQAREAEAEANTAAEQAREAVQAWQEQQDQHRSGAADALREADLLKARIESLDQRLQTASRRRQQLLEETGKTAGGAEDSGLEVWRQKEDEALAALEQAETDLQSARENLQSKNNKINELRDTLDNQRQELHQLEGRKASLEALQESALDDGQPAADWLRQQGLDEAPAVVSLLDIDDGWQTAVEMVLGDWLSARAVAQPKDYLAAASGLDSGRLALVEDAVDDGSSPSDGQSLANRVRGPAAIRRRLAAVRCAEDLDQALAHAANLPSAESIITPAGEWLGPGWARVYRSADAQAGMLQRAEELKSLGRRQQELSDSIAHTEDEVAALIEERRSAEQHREQVQTTLSEALTASATARSERQAEERRLEAQTRRAEQLSEEMAELAQQLDEDQASQREARARLQEVSERMAALESERTTLVEQRDSLQSTRQQAEHTLRDAREERVSLSLKVEAGRASLASLRQAIGRMDSQLGQLQQRFMQLSEQLSRETAPDAPLQEQLQKLLDRRVAVEQRLNEARATVQGLEADYREQDGQRIQAVQAADRLRESLQQARLAQRETELRAQSLAERVEALEQDVEALSEALPGDADPEAWEQELETLAGRIQRLEPVNLAAIQEYEQEQERKQYLDDQHDDLQQALSTLEGAIDKIDRKTRTQFKDTFERVNKGVQALFPKLFGGGHAYLELTGDDLLTTGVTIMARPPGKRVSSIHLLSGGEKALTAVAFVFSLFRLNPAPFCLLDEVDAPLDDANVGRFSDMVREMAESVQFVFVTHNKITMEMANQLCGVTMREPGVSRLVTVDIEAAAQMVEADTAA